MKQNIPIILLDRLVSSKEFEDTERFFTTFTVKEDSQITYFKNQGFYYGPIGKWKPITYEELIIILSKNGIDIKKFITEWPSNWFEIPPDYRQKSEEIISQPVLKEEYERADEIIQKSREETAKSWINEIEKQIKWGNYNLAKTYLERVETFCLGNPEIKTTIKEIKARLT